MSTKNDGHYFCGAGGNRPDGLNETLTLKLYYCRYGSGRNCGERGYAGRLPVDPHNNAFAWY
ncbi:hypothetical protein E2R62_00940 [Citrobacter rodentium]|uniref:Copper resistance protein n=1 Tax=Citrobacter rodentium TaxID=67825 RepID=A0A482PD16_CITRO|nr:hypothetical protein E2R62_00940 [Citrobacter rodentium]